MKAIQLLCCLSLTVIGGYSLYYGEFAEAAALFSLAGIIRTDVADQEIKDLLKK